jgi:hypothetical protein
MMKYDQMPNVRIDGDSLLRGDILGFAFTASSSSRMAREWYENGVYWTLETIRKTWTGWAVLKAIATTHGKTVRIVPFTEAQQKGHRNELAHTSADNRKDAAPAGVVPYRGGKDNPKTPEDERFKREAFTGTGEGSDATIEFDPTKQRHQDTTLAHELVHALRDLRGKQNRVPTGSGRIRRFTNEEEFFAYVIESIYKSEKRYPTLSLGSEFGVVPDEWKTSQGFLRDPDSGKQFWLLLDKLNSQCGDLCAYLKNNVPAWVPFNPVREFLEHRDQYPLVGTPPWAEKDGA